MKTLRTLGRAGLVGWALLLSVPAWADDPQPLPIRRVVLYKHGVGYFERLGPVRASNPVELRFRAGQMNDVLKSLTTWMAAGGGVRAIAYDSTKTTERLLGEFSFDLRRDEGLPGLLRQLRGSRLKLQVGSTAVTGTLLSVERRTQGPPDKLSESYRITVMTDAASIQSLDLAEVQDLKFEDEALNQSLARYSEILSSTHKRDEKLVRIQTDVDGELFTSYSVEVPVWKASYRVVLDEAKRPLLQGWAIVDNTEDEDWNDVRLSLISGLPVSFITNLYDPRYKRRPVVELEEEVAVTPQTHEETLEKDRSAPASPAERERAKVAQSLLERRATGAKKVGGRGDELKNEASPAADMAAAEGVVSFEDDGSSVDLRRQLEEQQAETITQEVGDLFEYKINHPITIPRNRSALIPIVNSAIEGERVSIYNTSMRRENPLSAIKMKNSTGLTLEGGPLTILEANTYAGEALMKTIKAGEERFLSYAVDLAVRIATERQAEPERVHLVQIFRGNMVTHYKQVQSTTYTIANKDDRARKVYVEHPKRQEWTLRDTKVPVETTEHLYRFLVDVPAGETVKLPVKEEHPESTTYGLTNLTTDNLDFFVRHRYLSPDIMGVLRKLVDLKTQLSALDAQIAARSEEKTGIFRDQERLRQNMGSLRDNTDERALRARYVKKLEEGENRIAGLDQEIESLRGRRMELQKQVDEVLTSYGAEYKP